MFSIVAIFPFSVFQLVESTLNVSEAGIPSASEFAAPLIVVRLPIFEIVNASSVRFALTCGESASRLSELHELSLKTVKMIDSKKKITPQHKATSHHRDKDRRDDFVRQPARYRDGISVFA